MVRVGRGQQRERNLRVWRQSNEARGAYCRPVERRRYSRTSAPGAEARAEKPANTRCWKVVGSPSRTRTCDKAINSRLLYQLSYRGSRSRLYTPGSRGARPSARNLRIAEASQRTSQEQGARLRLDGNSWADRQQTIAHLGPAVGSRQKRSGAAGHPSVTAHAYETSLAGRAGFCALHTC
jgi:hypothetical protein